MAGMKPKENETGQRERLGSRLGFIMKPLFRYVIPVIIAFVYVYGFVTFKWR